MNKNNSDGSNNQAGNGNYNSNVNVNQNSNSNRAEEEFRASQTYRAISNGSSQAADKIASGIGTAASAIESFLGAVDRAISSNSGQPGGNAGQGGNAVPPGVHYSSQYNRPLTPPVRPRPPKVARTPKYPKPPRVPKPSAYASGGPQYVSQANGAAEKVSPLPVNKNLKMVREPGMAKYYLTGATAILYALYAPLYEPQHFIPFAVVVATVFLLSSKIFKGKKKYVEVPAEIPKAEPVKTGISEVDKTIEEGNAYLQKLKAANEAIPEEALSESIYRIEQASAGIFHYVAENPSSAPQIRKFLNYYLPATMKLLDSYRRLSAQTVKGETITSTMQDIERMLYTVAGAFEKQLDSLFSEEALDISTDISVFETMLRQEGYVQDQPKEGLN